MTSRANNGAGEFHIRLAVESDAGAVWNLVRGLATHVKRIDDFTATVDSMADTMFRRKLGEALLAFEGDDPVGVAVFYPAMSSFIGLPGLYLEDLFVMPEARGKGYGKKLMIELARIALDRGFARLEWVCRKWNTPSLAFYRALGAGEVTDLNRLEMDEAGLSRLAKGE